MRRGAGDVRLDGLEEPRRRLDVFLFLLRRVGAERAKDGCMGGSAVPPVGNTVL